MSRRRILVDRDVVAMVDKRTSERYLTLAGGRGTPPSRTERRNTVAVTLAEGTGVHQQARYDVGGVLLERPFKIRRLGHFGFNVTRFDDAVHFYTDLLGFMVSDELDFAGRLPPEAQNGPGGTRGVFTRHGTDHHSFVLFPRGALERMGMGGGQVTI